LIEAEKKATKINANGISNRNRAEISIMSCGNNVIEALVPFSFQFFTRLAAVFAEVFKWWSGLDRPDSA